MSLVTRCPNKKLNIQRSSFLFCLLLPVSQIQAVWCNDINTILCFVFYFKHQTYQHIVFMDSPATNTSTHHSGMDLSGSKLTLL